MHTHIICTTLIVVLRTPHVVQERGMRVQDECSTCISLSGTLADAGIGVRDSILSFTQLWSGTLQRCTKMLVSGA